MSRDVIASILAVALGLFAASAAVGQTPAPAVVVAPAGAPPLEIRRPDLIADYFAAVAEVRPAGAVIVLGGSEGGLRGSRGLAYRLSLEGFDAIAVSYFGEEGQSALLDRVPIEPIARAREWLESRPGHRGRIAILGVSKGAELALLAASRDPRLGGVVAGVPSNLVWQGIDQTGGATGSSWTSGGQPLAYAPYGLSGGFVSVFKLYEDGLPLAPAEAEIPVERIAGPILLVSGAADSLWPSAEMARRVEARLTARGFAYPVTNLIFADVGHGVFGPPVERDTPGLERALSFGGTLDGLVEARREAWPRILAFLREATTAD